MKHSTLALHAVLAALIGGHSLISAAQQKLIVNPGTADEEAIDLQEGSAVSIDPLTGNVRLFTDPVDACSAQGPEGSGCEGVQASITSFTVNGSTSAVEVVQGQSITMAWNTRGAWQCAGSGLSGTTWNGSQNHQGSRSVNTGPLEPGSYTAILNCSNASVNASPLSRSVTVLDSSPPPDSPPECVAEGRVPPPGMTRDSAIRYNSSATTLTWKQFFGLDFPRGNKLEFEIDRNRYAALEFNSADFQNRSKGKVLYTNPEGQMANNVSPGIFLISISQCPGDFTGLEGPGCVRHDGRWIRDDETKPNDCNLQPNTKYYFNVIFTDDTEGDPLNWECTGDLDRCGGKFEPTSS